MDMNVYLIEWWARERMDQVRADALRAQLAEALRQRPPLRVVLGLALIRLGRRLQGGGAAKAADAVAA
jgi:hypothetical protein